VRGVALVRTGNLFDPADKVGLATVTGTVIRSGGTKANTGDQLDEQLENIAASVESNIGESYGTVSFSCLKENTDEVLGIFQGVLTSPEFRDDKIDLAKTQLRSNISRQNDDPGSIASREFASLIYGKDNAYGWDMTYGTVDNIQRADLTAFYKRYYFPANIILAVQGDFSAPEMKAKLEKNFASWTYTQAKVPPFPPVKKHQNSGVYVATKKDVTQTTFAVGQLAGTLDDKDYPALEVMADILGGGFHSRLFLIVRSKLGNAYSINADWGANYDHPGVFEVTGSTKSASTADTFKVIQQEVDKIRTEPVTPQELDTAKQSVVNSFVFNFDTSSKTLNRLLVYHYFNYPEDFLFRYQKAIEAVSAADVLRVAKARLDPAAFALLAVGNPAEFGKPLSETGLPVKQLDISIAEPKASATESNPETIAVGKSLLQKAQQAAGGADKLAAIKDLSTHSQTQVDASQGGLKAEQTNHWIAPSLFRQDAQYPFGKISVYFDGNAGWLSTPQGSMSLSGAPRTQMMGELFRFYIPLLMSDRNPDRKVNLVSEDVVEISGGDESVRLTFDQKTGLLSKEEYRAPSPQGPPLTVSLSYSDFQPVNGVQFPRKWTITQNGKKYADVTVLDVKTNSGLKQETLARQP
jgi:zinc protease